MKKGDKCKFVSTEAMVLRKQRISDLINSTIDDIKNEIELHKKGIGTDSSIPTLQQIAEELLQMKSAMSPKVYMPTYNYMIRDSWGEFSKLGEKLLKVLHDYKDKLD